MPDHTAATVNPGDIRRGGVRENAGRNCVCGGSDYLQRDNCKATGYTIVGEDLEGYH